MKFYFAPLEGITGYIYRNTYNEFFGGIDKYFIPFISPGVGKKLKTREIKDVSADNNKGMYAVPQILTNNAEAFIKTACMLEQLGYTEVNLNIGCPSGTVVAKNKGAGLLKDVHVLDKFLDQIMRKVNVKVSVKTRIGMEDAYEFEDILKVYNQYLLEELIIHPRVREDYYKNSPNLEVYHYTEKNSVNKLCYNGDIYSKESYQNVMKQFSKTKAVMLGRGLISNPFLMEEIRGEGNESIERFLSVNDCPRITEKFTERVSCDLKRLKAFHDSLLEAYLSTDLGEVNTLFKMKEVWYYMISNFDEQDKKLKKIRKTKDLELYKNIIEDIFNKSNKDY